MREKRRPIERLIEMLTGSICKDLDAFTVARAMRRIALETKIDALLDEAWTNAQKPKRSRKKAK